MIDKMSLVEIQNELRSYRPLSDSDVIRTLEHVNRRAALWLRLDVLVKYRSKVNPQWR